MDDHALFTYGLEVMLREEGIGVETARLRSSEDLVDHVQATRPDVVLLDLDLGDRLGDGTDLVAPFVAAGSRVLVVSGTRHLHRFGAALELGAADYTDKSEPLPGLVKRIRQLAAGSHRPEPARRARALAALSSYRRAERARLGPLEALTPREQAVLRALTRGLTATEVASAEWVSECTVRSQIRGILRKLQVTSQVQAVALALRSGWAIDAEVS